MIDIETIQQLLITAAWLVPVIAAVVQVVKVTWPKLDGRFTPVISLVVGVAVSLVVIGLTPIAGFAGLIFGLTASGLYDIGKKTVAGV
jgi:hypothetical protein